MPDHPRPAQQLIGDFAPITHLAFYSGWPTAMSAILMAKQLFEPAAD